MNVYKRKLKRAMMSDESRLNTQTPTGYKNAAARVLPDSNRIAVEIRNRALNSLPQMYQDLFETLQELGVSDERYKKEAINIKWAAQRLNIDTREW